MKFMKSVQPKLSDSAKATKTAERNENLKNLKPLHGKTTALPAAKEPSSADISENAKTLNASPSSDKAPDTSSVESSAKSVASTLAKMPVLPIVVPSESKDVKKIEDKLSDAHPPKLSFIKKPAVIFIEGFSAFGISNGDGIKDMADNLPGSKRFSWNEQDKIIDEIKKHAPDQPVVLVGHSFGGDSAVEIANTLNNVKNGFRSVDLLVSIDSVGMNHSIIPMNVKRNLNFFGEGVVPFLHGDPNVARNTDYTEVQNELRTELHSKMEDSQEVQFKIFESINEVLADRNQPDLFEEMQKNSAVLELIGSLPPHSKQ
jgi:hypothetical protein